MSNELDVRVTQCEIYGKTTEFINDLAKLMHKHKCNELSGGIVRRCNDVFYIERCKIVIGK